jgi:hypothetical protein
MNVKMREMDHIADGAVIATDDAGPEARTLKRIESDPEGAGKRINPHYKDTLELRKRERTSREAQERQTLD